MVTNCVLGVKRATRKEAIKITDTGSVPHVSAKNVIDTFLKSGEPGIKVEFTRTTIIKAAEDMFTAKGLRCPVMAIERDGETYLINRDSISSNDTT